MRPELTLAPATLPPGTEALRLEVRAFLADAGFEPQVDSWLTGFDPEFSRQLGARGWLGMTVPARYGGHGRSTLERFVVTEELLAAGAPVAAHWISDRQAAPSLLAHGTEAQRQRFLPAIARGECFFAIGMSEPDSGSDLASVRTRAERVDGGWLLTGTKIWTSWAQHAHAIVVLARTSPPGADRHAGLGQFIVTSPAEGLSIRPIEGFHGAGHFNEVVFSGVFVPDGMVLGEAGDGWRQVTAELAFERSGPERMLSTFRLIRHLGGEDRGQALARLWCLRQASMAIAQALSTGHAPEVAAALVKDLGTRFEGEVIDLLRLSAGAEPDPHSADPVARELASAVLQSPGFTLRGGTSQVLRGIVARGLGVR